MDAHRPLAGAEASAVQVSSVGAPEIPDPPTVRRGSDLGMTTTDGAVVEDNFESGKAPGAEQGVTFPDHPLDIPVDAPQANVPLHLGLPLRLIPASLVRAAFR